MTTSTSLSVLHDIIARSLVDPDHPAAIDPERQLSFAQLIDEAGRLGGSLRARGVSEGDRVALLIPNSVDFVVAALACLWIGAVFVPLAVTDPLSRQRSIVANCSPALVLTDLQGGADPSLSFDNAPLVGMGSLRCEVEAAIEPVGASERAAYLIYTSGTTGAPKGVQIGVDAFASAVWSTANALELGPDTRTLCVSPFHFDGSYANLFPTLVSGGTVVIRPREALLYPRTFFKAVASEKITYSGFTPSYLRLLMASRQIGELKNSTLTMIALGGEALSAGDLITLWSHAPGIRVFNRYGPTEATIAVTNVELTPEMIEDGPVTIGRPHPNVSFLLMDDGGKVIDAAHQTGELYIGGNQLMIGYWADPALTHSVLLDVGQGELMYRTGDLVYRDELGNYFFVDRADRVIKRSGVRISLVELSELLGSMESVIAAACLTFDLEGELGIVAFLSTDRELSDAEIRREARTLIPDNMLPDRFERVSIMPLNRSNQLDDTELLLSAGLRKYLRDSI